MDQEVEVLLGTSDPSKLEMIEKLANEVTQELNGKVTSSSSDTGHGFGVAEIAVSFLISIAAGATLEAIKIAFEKKAKENNIPDIIIEISFLDPADDEDSGS